MTDIDDIWAAMQEETQSVLKKKPTISPKKDKSSVTLKVASTNLKSNTTSTSIISKAAFANSSISELCHEKKNNKSQSSSTRSGFSNDAMLSSMCTGNASKDDEQQKLIEIEKKNEKLDLELGDVPLTSSKDFIAHIKRDINCIQDRGITVRQQSARKLERLFTNRYENMSSDIFDAAIDEMLKPLLKRIQRDESAKMREISARILRILLQNTPDITNTLEYLVPILVSRLNSQDLDNVAHLPQPMRPNPEQRPCTHSSIVEDCEEVRMELALLVQSFALRLSTGQVLPFIDDLTGLIRALCMDPYAECKAIGCEVMISFCYNNKDVLLHFAPPLGRSLTSCLIHKHSKLRILALQAITAILFCGIWKTNHEVIQHLVAWQDPNQVPLKAFYEVTTTVNYFSSITFDRSPAVRRFWFETLAYWLLRVPDHTDHEPHIFPYILSGLYDENEDIAIETFWLLEACGASYELNNEKDIREQRQYGMDAPWTYKGRTILPFPLQGKFKHPVLAQDAQGPDYTGDRADSDELTPEPIADDTRLALPERDYSWPDLDYLYMTKNILRPRLGARMWVRTHVRRFVKALFNNVLDFRECNMLNAARLLIMCMSYVEENLCEWLHPLMELLIKYYSGKAYMAGMIELGQTYDTVSRLVGVYVDPDALWPQFQDVFSPTTVWYLEQRVAVLHILTHVLDGSISIWETVYKRKGLLDFILSEQKDATKNGTVITYEQNRIKPADSEDTEEKLGLNIDKQPLGAMQCMIPDIVQYLFSCDLLHECEATSDGLGVAETLWNLLAMISRIGSKALSYEIRTKILIMLVAVFGALRDDGAPMQYNADFVVVQNDTDESDDLNNNKNAGREYFEKTSFGLIGSGKGIIRQKSENNTLSIHEKLGMISRKLDVQLSDIIDDMVKYANKNVWCIFALTEVLPIKIVVNNTVIWDTLRYFCRPEEEHRIRSRTLQVCAELMQAEYTYAISKKTIDMYDIDDIDDDDGDDDSTLSPQYMVMRKKFYAHLLENFSTCLCNATKATDGTRYSLVMQCITCIRSLLLLTPNVASQNSKSSNFNNVNVNEDLAICKMVPISLLEALGNLIVDVEYYKKVCKAIERAERISANKPDEEDFPVLKSKEMRETGISKADSARVYACDTLSVALRDLFLAGCMTKKKNKSASVKDLDDVDSDDENSPRTLLGGKNVVEELVSKTEKHPLYEYRSLFKLLRKLLKSKFTPKLEPLFVRPTSPVLMMYISETLRLFTISPSLFWYSESELIEDAAKQVNKLKVLPVESYELEIYHTAEDKTLTSDGLLQLLDLNLSFPPPPDMKPVVITKVETPHTKPDLQSSSIAIGWVDDFDRYHTKEDFQKAMSTCKSEDLSLLCQSAFQCMQQNEECLRWNSGLALYKLLMGIVRIDPVTIASLMFRWEQEQKHGRLILARNLFAASHGDELAKIKANKTQKK